MDTFDAILGRRSVRLYTSKPVSESMVAELLKAAMAAPSAGNEQPWHFVVITERTILDAIPAFHPYSAMLKHASVAVLVCGDLRLEKYKGCWVQDCSAATENLLLAATAKGLGSVWTAIYPFDERIAGIRKLLNLPDEVVPLSLVPLGYPAQNPGRADRFDAGRIHRNAW
ncbi:MAG: nitroreductase family protein [Nitrospiraceae bacterium]|nr:nitroreductase family protein [Nitrospiraceae bacterium]